jgi:reactive chlorine resistance protein C
LASTEGPTAFWSEQAEASVKKKAVTFEAPPALTGAPTNRRTLEGRCDMLTNESTTSLHGSAGLTPRDHAELGWFDVKRTARLETIGRGVLRYGLVALLLLWGGMKFTTLEAEGIRPLIEHSPFMSWMYPAFGVRGASAIIGIVELTAAVLIATRRFKPNLSAIGSLIASFVFLVTLSFLVTTPGVLAPDNPFGGFLMKDIIFLGAALVTAAEALAAAARTHAE